MKYLYKEFEMNGVLRIGEMRTVSDATPGASTKYLDKITDENGLECYRLIDNEPSFVGPRPMSAAELENAIQLKIDAEYPFMVREALREKALNSSLEGKTKPQEYNNYLERKIAIRQELEAKELLKKY